MGKAKPYKRKARGRKRRRKASVPRLLARTGMNGTHMVKQKTFENFQIGALGLPEFSLFEYSIAGLPQLVSFQKLYDRYTIYSVTTQIIMNDFQPPAGNQSFSAAISIDKDSVSALPPDWDTFIERGNVKMKTMTTGYKGANSLFWKQKPKPLSPLYKSALTSGYQINATTKPIWIDMRDPSVPHYGALVGFNNAAAALNVPINCTVIKTFYIGFRGLQ